MTSTLIPRRPVGAFGTSVLGFLGRVRAVSAVDSYKLSDKVRKIGREKRLVHRLHH